MAKRYVNLKHLGFIRSRPCIVCGTDYEIEAHHLLKPWRGPRGMALKAGDENVVPLCAKHHRELHNNGNEYDFFEKATGRADNGQFYARLNWLGSPHYESLLDDK